VDHTQQRANRQARPELEPRVKLLPGPAVHADLASLAALAVADHDGAARAVKVGLGKRERFADPQASAPQQHDQGAQPQPVGLVANGAHDSDDLLARRRVGRVALPFVARRAALVVAGHRRWRATVTGGVQLYRPHESPFGLDDLTTRPVLPM
jgi:hypothetical protein